MPRCKGLVPADPHVNGKTGAQVLYPNTYSQSRMSLRGLLVARLVQQSGGGCAHACQGNRNAQRHLGRPSAVALDQVRSETPHPPA